MLLTLVFIAGFALGWFRAGRVGGDRLDRLQYGAAHAIALTLAVFVAWIIAIRLGLL
jgi:hypothetical protein